MGIVSLRIGTSEELHQRVAGVVIQIIPQYEIAHKKWKCDPDIYQVIVQTLPATLVSQGSSDLGTEAAAAEDPSEWDCNFERLDCFVDPPMGSCLQED